MSTSVRWIVELSAGWDEDRSTGPRAPLSWESVARMAMDYARAALSPPSAPAASGAPPVRRAEAVEYATTLADKWVAWAVQHADEGLGDEPNWHDAIVGAVMEALASQRERSARIMETGKTAGLEAFWVASEAARFIHENRVKHPYVEDGDD